MRFILIDLDKSPYGAAYTTEDRPGYVVLDGWFQIAGEGDSPELVLHNLDLLPGEWELLEEGR
jgi:hypothetical protein